MASRRAIIEPNLKEEMMYSMESVANQLKNLVDTNGTASICGGLANPLDCGDEGCDCSSELPIGCKGTAGYPDGDKYFVYFVRQRSATDSSGKFSSTVNEINMKMKCNGEIL